MPRTLIALAAVVAAAATVLAGALPNADDIRTDAIARGATFVGAARSPVGGLSAAGVCFGGLQADELPLARPLGEDNPFVRQTAFVCRGLGTYWIAHEDSRVMAMGKAWIGPFPHHALAGRSGLARRIAADLEARGIDFFVDGTAAPGQGPGGETVPDLQSGGVLVALDVPPPQSADFFTDVAWVDPASELYWAHRTGGIAGADLWVGPFPAPLLIEGPPTAVEPSVVKARRRAVRRTVTIFREVTGDDSIPVRRRDYRRRDFDFGPGVRVLRVLRANRHSIRLRIRIARNAAPGDRPVRVRGNTVFGLFRIE